MNRRRPDKKNIEIFSLSFLDVVSCGFGAIILLLVLSKISQPIVIEKTTVDLNSTLKKLEEEKVLVQGQVKKTFAFLTESKKQLLALQREKELKAAALSKIKGEFDNMTNSLETQSIVEQQLKLAKQKLTDEIRRLQRNKPISNKENTIGGISVNSEYIIFIIDTSGSMQNYAWSQVRKKMKEILKVHPEVKGIQIMNDMGDYMFSQYSGQWIKDTPGRRRAILKRLASWEPFSNSSPEEGITRAIKAFYAADKNISLYVFGDDFSRGSIQALIDTVDRLNQANRSGHKRVRINAVGFPVLFNQKGAEMNIARFSALMRKLSENNNGSFVGLTELQ